jgi:hypothetical protein
MLGISQVQYGVYRAAPEVRPIQWPGYRGEQVAWCEIAVLQKGAQALYMAG